MSTRSQARPKAGPTGRNVDALGAFLTCSMYFVFATTFVAAKFGLQSFPPFVMGSIRTALAALFLFFLCLRGGYAFPREPRRLLAGGLLGFLMAGAPSTVGLWGVQHTQASLATVIMATQPFLVAALAHRLLANDRLSRRKVLGLATGFLGVGLISLDKTGASVELSLVGQLAILANAVSVSLAAVFGRAMSRHWQVLPFTAVQTAGGFVLALAAAVVFEREAGVQASPAGVAAVVYLALVPTLLGYLLWVFLLARHRASSVSSFAFAQPAFGILIGWLVLAEPFGWLTVVGMMLITWSILTVNRGR